MNLDHAFQNLVGETSCSVFVYFDVGGGNVVGNQVTELLREIKFQREGKGLKYFKPLHIKVVDSIILQVDEATGELCNFSEGNTILTLQFKKT